MWFWLSWRDHTTLMQFPLECATLLSAPMFRHPWLRCRLPSDQHEYHRALWRSAKTTGQHLGEGKDDVISISYHLSPDFFHYQAGHWLWRRVKRPGLWTALHKLKEPAALWTSFFPWGSGPRLLPSIKRSIERPNESNVKPSGADFVPEWLGKRCQIASWAGEKTQATKGKGEDMLAFSIGGILYFF